MRTCIAVAVLLAITSNTFADDDPRDVVERFYTAYIDARPPGLPDGEDLDRIKPFLSDHLYALIVDALKYRDEMIRRFPDAKPPYVDGDHFTSSFEGPKSFQILEVDGENVHVEFRYDDATWQDVIVVKDGLIDDVIYGGAGDFNPPGRLSDNLKAREPEAFLPDAAPQSAGTPAGRYAGFQPACRPESVAAGWKPALGASC